MVLKTEVSRIKWAWITAPSIPLMRDVNLAKLLNFYKSQFPHLQNIGDH